MGHGFSMLAAPVDNTYFAKQIHSALTWGKPKRDFFSTGRFDVEFALEKVADKLLKVLQFMGGCDEITLNTVTAAKLAKLIQGFVVAYPVLFLPDHRASRSSVLNVDEFFSSLFSLELFVQLNYVEIQSILNIKMLEENRACLPLISEDGNARSDEKNLEFFLKNFGLLRGGERSSYSVRSEAVNQLLVLHQSGGLPLRALIIFVEMNLAHASSISDEADRVDFLKRKLEDKCHPNVDLTKKALRMYFIRQMVKIFTSTAAVLVFFALATETVRQVALQQFINKIKQKALSRGKDSGIPEAFYSFCEFNCDAAFIKLCLVRFGFLKEDQSMMDLPQSPLFIMLRPMLRDRDVLQITEEEQGFFMSGSASASKVVIKVRTLETPPQSPVHKVKDSSCEKMLEIPRMKAV